MRSAGRGGTSASSSCRAWATPSASATCGGSLTSATRTAAVSARGVAQGNGFVLGIRGGHGKNVGGKYLLTVSEKDLCCGCKRVKERPND